MFTTLLPLPPMPEKPPPKEPLLRLPPPDEDIKSVYPIFNEQPDGENRSKKIIQSNQA